MRAEKQVRKLSRSEKRYYTVEMDRLKDKVDLFSRQQFAHDKGLAEGRAEGLVEGREEGLAVGRQRLILAGIGRFAKHCTFMILMLYLYI